MKVLCWIVGGLLVAGFIFVLYFAKVTNPKVLAELQAEPTGERARIVMALSFPDGKQIPVNYLRDGMKVYVGADFPWWREFVVTGQSQSGVEVNMLIKGQQLRGKARAITDDLHFRDKIFARLRPTAPEWLPESLKGVLIEIEITET